MALSSKIETINIPRINMEIRNTNIKKTNIKKAKAKAVIDCNIDDEWSSFITSHNDDLSDNESENDISDNEKDLSDNESKCDIIEEEEEDRDVFGNTLNSFVPKTKNMLSHKTHTHTNNNSSNVTIPEPSDIYISTKSKIAYLTDPIDLKIFWDIPVIPYATAKNGVIKKQIKFNSKTPEELNIIQERLQAELYYEEHVMSHIDNPNGRIKFKDIRKVTIGISKKDIMSYRSKKKQAFYNCFVMIIN